MDPKRKRLVRISLVFFSFALTIIFVELSYRFIIFGRDSFSIEKMNSFHRLGFSELVRPSDCKEMVYELVPELDLLFKVAHFQTNPAGQRDQPYSLQKPEGAFRIVVLGDSLTMGSGILIEDTYHALLEEGLQEKFGRPVETISFGTGGYSLRQYLGVLNCRAAVYQPDLVLVGFYPENDYQVPDPAFFERPYQLRGKDYPFFFPFALRELGSIGKSKAQGLAMGALGVLPEVPSEVEKDYMRRYLGELGAYSREAGVPVLVGYLAYRTDHALQPEVLSHFVEEAGLCFTDLSAGFTGTDPDEFAIYPIDGHPNEAANARFAEQLLAYFIENDLVNAGECR